MIGSIRYEDSDIALTYGAIARECIRHQCVARYEPVNSFLANANIFLKEIMQ